MRTNICGKSGFVVIRSGLVLAPLKGLDVSRSRLVDILESFWPMIKAT
jgi:hypothetical protein